MNKKATKEVILRDLADALNEASETIYNNYDGEVLSVGVVGFNDAQIIHSGVISNAAAAGLMLTVIKGLGKETKVFSDEDAEFVDRLIDKLKNSGN